MHNTETIDFKELGKKIMPDKHVCIKYNQQVARIGIICDSCITKLNHLISEFSLATKKEIAARDNS
jgi:hypothetical protein